MDSKKFILRALGAVVIIFILTIIVVTNFTNMF